MPTKSSKAKLPESPIGCPMDRLLRLLMGHWTIHILWALCREGPLRFGVLKRSVPNLSAKVLTERLRLLEESNIIYRDHVPTIPPQVTYGLSERGLELVESLDQLFSVAQRWCEEDGKAASSDTAPPCQKAADSSV